MIVELINDGTHQLIKLPKGYELSGNVASATWDNDTLLITSTNHRWQKLHQALALFDPELVLEREAQGEQG